MKHLIFISITITALCFTISCLKDEVKPQDYETETRQWSNDTVYVWYPELHVVMNVTGTHQYQFENVTGVTIDTIPDYYSWTFPNGQVVYYDGYEVSINCLSGTTYQRIVKEIRTSRAVDYTEISQEGTDVISSTCGKSQRWTIRHRYASGQEDKYSLCKLGNHPSGAGSRFLFVNR